MFDVYTLGIRNVLTILATCNHIISMLYHKIEHLSGYFLKKTQTGFSSILQYGVNINKGILSLTLC